MATLIRPDGRRTEHRPNNPKKGFSLDELKALVECDWIEVAHFGPAGKFFVLDEEGKLNGKPYNAGATALYRESGLDDIIVGNALLCAPGEVR